MYSPNFLSAIALRTGVRPSCAFLVLLLAGTAALFGLWQFSASLVLFIIALVGGIFLVLHLEVGLYALLLSGFFLGLYVDLSVPPWRSLPLISGLYAPLGEFIGLVCLGALIIAWMFRVRPFSTHLLIEKMWGLRFYGPFLLITFLSAVTVFDGIVGESLRYTIRTLCFVYAAFFWFPLIMIRERATLEHIIKIWSWLGIAIALFGFSSLVFAPQGDVIRLVPYAILGFAPLQFNHNLLAEPLVALLPLVGALAYRSEGVTRTFYGVGALLMTFAVLLTLSRAAWLALSVQAIVLFLLVSRTRIRQQAATLGRSLGFVALLLIPVLLYMVYFLQTSIVSSSTTARYAATEVAWFYATREPFIGNGPGSYQKLLGDTYTYTLDFGDPLEAHGFIQKVLVEEGGIGFLFFALFLIAIIVFLYTKERTTSEDDRPFAMAFLLMALGIMVFELFNTSYFQSVMWLPLGVAVAGSMLLKRNPSLS